MALQVTYGYDKTISFIHFHEFWELSLLQEKNIMYIS